MTSAHQLNSWLKRNDKFMGSFSSEKLPKFPKSLPKSLIINLRVKNKKIGHWVGVILKREECLFFDTYGRKVMNNKVINFLSPHYKYVVFNRRKIQHNKSKKCGEFTFVFINSVYSRCDFNYFINLFYKCNILKNDQLILFIMNKIIFKK